VSRRWGEDEFSKRKYHIVWVGARYVKQLIIGSVRKALTNVIIRCIETMIIGSVRKALMNVIFR
jgi:hypothetical protein